MYKLALVLMAFSVSFAAQARTLNCDGVYDENKGADVVLKLNKNSYSLYGTSVEGDGFGKKVNCSGQLTGTKNQYNLFSSNTNERSCPVDYVKISSEPGKDGSVMLVLARRSGGDTHDSSGYSYRYYRCE